MTPEEKGDAHQLLRLIGRNIERLRRLRGLTHAQLGQRVGCSDRAIAAIEAGRRQLRIDDLALLSGALDVAPDELFSRDRDEPMVEE